MTTITEADIDSVYDAIETLNVSSQLLSQGDADKKTMCSIAWLLGSTSKRLGDILTILEELQHDQQSQSPPMVAESELDLLSEVMALTAKFNRRRQGVSIHD
jgi:hypothetical protein